MAKQRVDCAVVIALREEFTGDKSLHGFEEFFDIVPMKAADKVQRFKFTDISGQERAGVVAVMEEMSPLFAYATTRNILDEYDPAVIVNIGIAGALSKDLRLGDVIVADEVELYDYRGKAVSSADSKSDFKFHWGGRAFSPSSDPTDQVARLWQQRKSLESWQKGCRERLKSSSAHSDVSNLTQQGYLRDPAKIERGKIASGNVVGASTAFRDSLINSHSRTLRAIEMESFGVLWAAHNRCRTLVIKAVSDLADENKTKLEETTNDGIRAWAMSNAFQLLSIACRSVVSFERQADIDSRDVSLEGQSPQKARDRLLVFSKRHFKKQHQDLETDLEKNLLDFDALFRPLVHYNGLTSDNLFRKLAQTVLKSDHSYPLRVDGKPGTGKTTFLTLLTLALYKLCDGDSDAPVPIFINLRRYTTPDRGRERDWNPHAEAEDDLGILRKLLGGESGFDVIVIVDGVDEYVRHDDAIEMQLLNLIADSPSARKIVSVGVNYLADRERFKRRLRPDLSNPETKVLIEAVPLGDGTVVNALLAAYRTIYSLPVTDDVQDRAIKKALTFRLESLDLLIVSMLFKEVTDNRDEQANNLSNFFHQYCENFLSTPAGNETLEEAAELAFNYTVRPDYKLTDVDITYTRGWKLLHLHPTIRDFLVAWHAVGLIRRYGDSSNQLRLEDLEYVYPHSINRFGKDIVNSSRHTQFEVINGAKSLFSSLGQNSKPHAVYLAGRVEDSEAKIQAEHWLRTVCLAEVKELERQNEKDLSASELLLCRTVYISLAYLRDRRASSDYIKLLLDRPRWNTINRGFHLEYYGDIPFEPERQLSHLDNLAPFPKTFSNLYGRVVRGLSTPVYGLLDIEIFTLFSLAQYRYVSTDRLLPEIREALVRLAPIIARNWSVSEDVRDYVKMLEINLGASKPYSPANLVEKLFGLKTELRAGWIDRDLNLSRVESVAEHTLGCLILAIVFLPENHPTGLSGYDKHQILSYLMVHDFGEAIAGDASPLNPQKARVSKEKERDAHKFMLMSRTYNGVADLAQYYYLWKAFEENTNDNARVAKDIDKLENLMQLYLYRRQAKISDEQSWIKGLKEAISTEIGIEIRTRLEDYFEST